MTDEDRRWLMDRAMIAYHEFGEQLGAWDMARSRDEIAEALVGEQLERRADPRTERKP